MILGLNDCILYKARTAHEDIVGWDVVLASDWGMHSYPKWMTGCVSQHVTYNGRYVVASFCAQALGAGGGCAGGDGTCPAARCRYSGVANSRRKPLAHFG